MNKVVSDLYFWLRELQLPFNIVFIEVLEMNTIFPFYNKRKNIHNQPSFPLPLPPEFFGVKIANIMARICQVTGKVPVTGNRVSHSNIKTKRRFLPNLQTKKFYLVEEDKWVTLKLSTEAIRTINKNGLYNVVKELRKAGQKI